MAKRKFENNKLKQLDEFESLKAKLVFDKACKIYNDGGHFVAKEIVISNGKKRYHNSIVDTEKTQYFDSIYFDALDKNFTYNQLVEYLKENMLAKYPDIENIDEYIEKRLLQSKRNLFNRIKRFKRKANLNYWNYFVTITYDDKKHNATSFRQKLRKCLSNLHTRYGWKYMGVFELSPTKERLHFHAIMYIPKDSMVGTIKELKDYSTAQHKLQITHCNSFFAERFGRNDFEELKEEEIRNGNALEYLTKYLYKTNERIVYSRGIPTEIYRYINDKDIATEMYDFITKYVLFDDVIDCKTDIMHFPIRQTTLFESLHVRLNM